jgi:hypothetical protein
MKHEGMDARVWLALPVLGGLLISGCNTLGWDGDQTPVTNAQLTQADPEAVPDEGDAENAAAPDSEEDNLAKVANFIRALEEYGEDGAPGEASASRPASRRGAMPPTGDRLNQRTSRPPRAVTNRQLNAPTLMPEVPTQTVPVVERVVIRTAQPAHRDVLPVESGASTTNQPLGAQPENAVDRADEFLALLRTEAEENGTVESEWRLRLAEIALHYEGRTGDFSASLPADQRAFLRSFLKLAIASRRAAHDPTLFAEDALAELEDFRAVLSEQADPQITTVHFCRHVYTFGNYDEMDPGSFIAGRSIPAVVYFEIRNFRSELTQENLYKTELATQFEVLTADGISRWSDNDTQVADLCRGLRTDFFLAKRITLPPTLPPGAYVLKVRVEDKLANKMDEYLHSFEILPPTTIADGS